MSLNDLSDLGQFISSVAVLASLIYLSIQVQDAKRNQRALIMEGRAARASALSAEIAHPELAGVLAKLATESGELTHTEFWQFRFIVRAAVNNFENLYFQYKQGLMDDAGFESVKNAIRSNFRSPHTQTMWEVMVRFEFSSEFVGFVDGVIAEQAGQETSWSDAYAQWQKLLAKKMAAT